MGGGRVRRGRWACRGCGRLWFGGVDCGLVSSLGRLRLQGGRRGRGVGRLWGGLLGFLLETRVVGNWRVEGSWPRVAARLLSPPYGSLSSGSLSSGSLRRVAD